MIRYGKTLAIPSQEGYENNQIPSHHAMIKRQTTSETGTSPHDRTPRYTVKQVAEMME